MTAPSQVAGARPAAAADGRAGLLGLAALALAGALAASTRDADLTLAGPRPWMVALLVLVPVALALAAIREPRWLSVAVVWPLAQLAGPAAPGSVAFTAGLVLGAATPVAVAWAAPTRAWPLLVPSALVLGPLSAVLFDPAACEACPANLLLVHGDGTAYDALQRAGVWLGLAGAVAVALATLRRAPAVALYLALVAAQYAHGLARGYVSTDPLDRGLWALQGLALLAVAAGTAREPLRRRAARARLARLIVELEAHPAPRGLGEAIAGALGDPELELGYRLSDGRLYDANGRALAPGAGRELTPLPEGRAELAHAPGAVDAGLAAAIAAAARLPLHNERLRAEQVVRAAQLRAIRARIVAASDAERRRLERDLHDGAQQRLATLAVTLEVARLRAERTAGGSRDAGALLAAQGQVRAALAALRDIAGGLVPPVLADEGLARAVEAFAEAADVRIDGPLPEGRFPPEIETTAYRVLTESIRHAEPAGAAVHAVRERGRLRLRVTGVAVERVDLVALDDHVGALGGALEAAPGTISAELPCG
ncbi:histidine kinase [Solirubrobacter soli]|uniref:histidine kinase n=1 Tax=Solirubrobacter soli TaxID=363832 RepID=UPI0004176B64|nr:histidine kinase [Solirubrobacter soli]